MQSNPFLRSPNLTPKKICNVLERDFTFTYLNDNNDSESLTIPALDIVTLPSWLANLVAKHIADGVINDRELGYVTPEERAKIEEGVFV